MEKIIDIAQKIDFKESDIIPYGSFKAKITKSCVESSFNKKRKNGKLILVTATNPTPQGEGKTTVSIGIAQALQARGIRTTLSLREPSLGPVFGIKGGATGGGASRILPEDDINLHFTGDIHAITSAVNLIVSVIDTHLFYGNELNLNPERICVKRVLDINDRALRSYTIHSKKYERHDRFQITVASELMAILCLASTFENFKKRVSRIVIGFTYEEVPVYLHELEIVDAVCILMKDALLPNLVQSSEGVPAFIHGGPFANIAHGTSSILALQLAQAYSDIVVTEAGFSSELGAEKFLNIVSENNEIYPDLTCIVTTIRALQHHSPGEGDIISIENLEHHVEIMSKYSGKTVVILNRFPDDKDDEITYVCDSIRLKYNVECFAVTIFENGGEGALDVADYILSFLSETETYTPKRERVYKREESTYKKIQNVAQKMYGAEDIAVSDELKEKIKKYEHYFGKLPICIAKTPVSLSDNPKLLGRPKDFIVTIKDIEISNGAGFFIIYAGNVIDMPGLSRSFSAKEMKFSINSFEVEGIR